MTRYHRVDPSDDEQDCYLRGRVERLSDYFPKLSRGLSGASWWCQDGLTVSGSDVLAGDELGIFQGFGDEGRRR